MRALRVAKGQPELGRSPQAAVVMADMCHAGPRGGCKGLGRGLSTARVWRRTRELCHDVLTAFKKIIIKNKTNGAVSYSVDFVFKMLGFAGSAFGPAGGQGPAAVTYNAVVQSWLRKMCF